MSSVLPGVAVSDPATVCPADKDVERSLTFGAQVRGRLEAVGGESQSSAATQEERG